MKIFFSFSNMRISLWTWDRREGRKKKEEKNKRKKEEKREGGRDICIGLAQAKAKRKHLCWELSTTQKTHDSKNIKQTKQIKIPSKDELSINVQITHRNKCPTGVALNTRIILKTIGIFSIIDNLLSIYYVPGTGLSALNRSFNLVRSF